MPVSVSIITADLIEDMGVLALEDTAKYVSNVNTGGQRTTSGVGANLFTIRGFASGLVLRNGNVQNFRFGDMAFIDRVEIIKGPTSLYGETSPGGFANVSTKQAKFYDFASASFQVGSYDHYRAVFDVNTVVGDDKKTAVRGVAVFQDNQSKRQNENLQRKGLLFNVTHRPSESTRIWLDATFQDDEGVLQRDPFPFEGVDSGAPIPLGRDFTLTNSGDRTVIEDLYFELGLEHVFNENLSFQTSWSHNDLFRRFHTTFNGAFASTDPDTGLPRVPRWPGIDWVDGIWDTVNANLLWTIDEGDLKNEMILSVRDSSSEVASRNLIFFGDVTEKFPQFSPFKLISDFQKPEFSDFNISQQAILDFLDTDGPATNKGSTRVYGLTDRLSLMDEKLSFLGGIRYTEIDTPELGETTFQIGGNFKVADGVALYAGYAEGFQSNGIDSETGEVRPPRFSDSIEFGAKFEMLEHGLSGHIAYYDIVQNNIVNQGIFGVSDDGSGGGGTVSTLSGEQASDGIEIELFYTPMNNLQFIFGYFNQDAIVTNETGVITVDGLPVEEDRSGRTLMGSSPSGFNLWSKYGFTEGALEGFTIAGGFWVREGPIPQFPDFRRRTLVQADDISGVDLTFGYDTQFFGNNAHMALNLINVTNEKHLKQRGLYIDPVIARFTVRFDY